MIDEDLCLYKSYANSLFYHFKISKFTNHPVAHPKSENHSRSRPRYLNQGPLLFLGIYFLLMCVFPRFLEVN